MTKRLIHYFHITRFLRNAGACPANAAVFSVCRVHHHVQAGGATSGVSGFIFAAVVSALFLAAGTYCGRPRTVPIRRRPLLSRRLASSSMRSQVGHPQLMVLRPPSTHTGVVALAAFSVNNSQPI